MSLAIVHTRAKLGVEAPPVTVEVHLSNGLPSLSIVGMPETAVRESKDRVRSAILNSQLEFPARRITVNLAPADLPKEGGRYDLAIAIGILAASGQVPTDCLDGVEILGELALSGAVRQCDGCLPAALGCQRSQRELIVPAANSLEVALCENLSSYAADSLLAVCAHLHRQQRLPAIESTPISLQEDSDLLDLLDVKGQAHAKRALEIAASGGHHLLLKGSPGTGKTMLASRLRGLLPPLHLDEALEVASVYSVASQQPLTRYPQRPFRSPHHTASAPALVGGGSHPRPGEISLAHRGILFLDELPEFQRQVLEVLREPLEHGHITIARASAQISFPCRFQLIAAMNPCPCGYFGDGSTRCRCTPDQVKRYTSKISGPLLDRIDLQVSMSNLKRDELYAPVSGDSSKAVRERVVAVRQRQWERQGKLNRDLNAQDMDSVCGISAEHQQLLGQASERMGLSARGIHRLLKVARTLADMDAATAIASQHLMEALSYRQTVNAY